MVDWYSTMTRSLYLYALHHDMVDCFLMWDRPGDTSILILLFDPVKANKRSRHYNTSRKNAYIIVTPVNPTFI